MNTQNWLSQRISDTVLQCCVPIISSPKIWITPWKCLSIISIVNKCFLGQVAYKCKHFSSMPSIKQTESRIQASEFVSQIRITYQLQMRVVLSLHNLLPLTCVNHSSATMRLIWQLTKIYLGSCPHLRQMKFMLGGVSDRQNSLAGLTLKIV